VDTLAGHADLTGFFDLSPAVAPSGVGAAVGGSGTSAPAAVSGVAEKPSH